MQVTPTSPEEFGRTVFGPVLAEFYLRLHLLTSHMAEQRPGDGVLLFCARAGLRMQLGWDRFLEATALSPAMPAEPLMVSRLAAIRPALARTLTEDLSRLTPAVDRTVAYEFSRQDLATTVRALSGVEATGDQRRPTTPSALADLLRSPDGMAAAAAIVEQGRLFTRHLDHVRGGRTMPILVDSGLYGTTRAVLADAYPDLDVRSLMLARTLRSDLVDQQVGSFGLSVEAEVYSSTRRRTALLRHWHFVEWLFEPDLDSVKRFEEVPDGVRSNLEAPGWKKRVEGGPDGVFAGVLQHLEGLRPETVVTIPGEADQAWGRLKRAITRPTQPVARALEIGARSHDFGREDNLETRTWRGPVDALRSSMIWREGEIARSGGAWRVPLHSMIELAYTARAVSRAVTFRSRFRS